MAKKGRGVTPKKKKKSTLESLDYDSQEPKTSKQMEAQQKLLEQQPDIQEYYFSDVLGTQKIDENHTQATQEWENLKFFKH